MVSAHAPARMTFAGLLLSLLLCSLLGCAAPAPTTDEASAVSRAEQEADPSAGPATPALEAQAVDVESIVARLRHGIDVSTHSGAVDWSAMTAAGHGFAFAKATEGMDLTDASFAVNWPGMRDAGLVRGAYHFYVTEDDPDHQADFFIATVTLEPGDLAPVVDIEVLGRNTEPGLADRLRRFLDRLETHYGIVPILYTAPNFWDAHVGDTRLGDAFGRYPLWIAEYGVEQPRLPSGWTAWHLWQWQANVDVPGVPNGVDRNRTNADADLAALVVIR